MTRVLVTRAEPDASRFAAAIRAAGLDPILSPVMRIVIETAFVDLADISAVAFTSANGVRAFAANSGERDLPVFAVGPVTADAAKEAAFTRVGVAGGDVASLADHIASESELLGKGILHVAGADRAGDLVAALAGRGIVARSQTLYRAEAAERLAAEAAAALRDNSGLWVTLFSPRTVRLFLALVHKAGLTPRLGTVRAVCLSEAVADAASKTAWAEVAIASARTAESVLETIGARQDRA